MSRASGLFRLQKIDLEINQLVRRRSAIQAILEDSAAIELARAKLETMQQALRAAAADSRAAEHAVESQQEKIKATERALYGGTVQNPKELQDLQAESEALNRHLVTLEDRLLEAMLLHEEAESVHTAQAERVTRLEEELAGEHKALVAERQELEARLISLDAEREAALGSVAPEDLERYDRIRSKVGALAVATLQEGACNACGIAVAASTQQEIRTGAKLVTCPQCGRVLYSG